ncbi:Hypothetical predicted protein [Cloeon dipterum]|uniref:LRRCT domain-containing protein n=2 Tax=Cloeon dipterum TaxID=197152 RepID=A0A8S1D4S3_9INSE|nr:Hypothetical predicted protein [Cloeon dipterum]
MRRLLLLLFLWRTAAGELQSTAATQPPPSICVVCRCTRAPAGQWSVQCDNEDAVLEMTRGQVWPAQVRSIAVNHASLKSLPNLPAKQELHTLSLAFNSLSDLPDHAFKDFDLEELNMDNNALKDWRAEILQGNKNLKVLQLRRNDLQHFDWASIADLTQLRHLDLQENYVANLTGQPLDLHELKSLNLRGNVLVDFPTDTCSNLVRLEYLDLGNNKIPVVPECLQSHLGALQFLALDGNKISTVEGAAFTGLATLHTLVISNLADLKRVDRAALKGVSELQVFRCADNKQLESVDKTLFFMGEEKMQNDWKFKIIDLSGNGFKKIPNDLLPWTLLEFVDLQHNPWDCSCDAQWMVDSLLPTLYKINSSMLEEFRCATPAHLAPRRLVNWLNHDDKPFCKEPPGPETQVALLQSGSSQGMLIALTVIACVALALLVVGFVLQRRYDRQRRALATKMGRCRRPRNGDVRLTNPKFGI